MSKQETMTMVDKWEQFREFLGAERVDNFLAAFGMGPKYKPLRRGKPKGFVPPGKEI